MLTTGIGTTSAGLTCTAGQEAVEVVDGFAWGPEARSGWGGRREGGKAKDDKRAQKGIIRNFLEMFRISTLISFDLDQLLFCFNL